MSRTWHKTPAQTPKDSPHGRQGHAHREPMESHPALCVPRGRHQHPRAALEPHRHGRHRPGPRPGRHPRHGRGRREYADHEPNTQSVHRHLARHQCGHRQRHRQGRPANRDPRRPHLGPHVAHRLRRGDHRRALRRAVAGRALRPCRDLADRGALPARVPARHAVDPPVQLRGGHLQERRYHEDAAAGPYGLHRGKRRARPRLCPRAPLGRRRPSSGLRDRLHPQRGDALL